MTRTHMFADESGDLTFTNIDKPGGGSKYFAITTVSCDGFALGDDLAALRRDVIWRGYDPGAAFHAAKNAAPLRARVFDVLQRHDFRVDASIFDKRRVRPHLAEKPARFYKQAWYHHAKHVMPRVTQGHSELFVMVAHIKIGDQNREQLQWHLDDVLKQCAPEVQGVVGIVLAASEPCIQVADYCSWAIFRKHEHGNRDSHDLIATKIKSEFTFFTRGPVLRGEDDPREEWPD